jgi:GNAT superfamily N-acetyltransferase
VNFYTVLILELNNYKPSTRALPDGIIIKDGNVSFSVRKQERKILKRVFDDWQIPFEQKLTGWRDDSPVFALYKGILIGGVYLCDRNMLDGEINSGQLHYAFMDPKYKGMGIYSVLFREAMKKAKSWGLNRVYLNSDRYILPDVYIRWGAQIWKTIPKSSNISQNRLSQLLWQIKVSFRSILRRIKYI